ncbi:coiled-coil domain-containing protein 150-like [Glandiceps talaboti]
MTDNLRPPIPTIKSQQTTSHTLDVLHDRLNTAEQDTVNLIRQLHGIGINPMAEHPTKDTGIQPPLAPFQVENPDTEVLLKNYENLVSRVCKTESTIQSMKLNLCSLQAEHDLGKRDTESLSEKLAITTEAYDRDTKKLNRELARARKELKETMDERNGLEEDVRRVTSALEVATAAKTDLAAKFEEMKSTKQKLNKRLQEMREELVREISLRSSLEESHATLLERIQDMEGVVESERSEVKTLAKDCTQLRKEGIKAKAENKREYQLREQMESAIKQLTTQLETKDVDLRDVKEKNKVMSSTLTAMKKENIEMRNEMEQLRKVKDEAQATIQQLETENKEVHDALKTASSENAEMVETHRKALEAEKKASAVYIEERLKSLEESSKKDKEAKDSAVKKCQEMQTELEITKMKLSEADSGSKKDRDALESALDQLKDELLVIQKDKEAAMKDKENLLEEVNQAVDGMSEERTKLQDELAQAKLDITSLTQEKAQLDQENVRLMERMSAVEQQQQAQSQVDNAMKEMLESKNRLAYEKGRLQTKVDHLQEELSTLANAKTEVVQLRKMNSALETKFTKTNSDLGTAKIQIQRFESQLKQIQSQSERKEKDFSMAIKARDDAVKEGQRLIGHVEAVEERERQKIHSLQRSLSDAKQDNAKIASTLESVMSSHSQLQTTVENLQTELGRKDSEVMVLKSDRRSDQHSVQELQKEIDSLQNKLLNMESMESREVEPLRHALEKAKADSIKMAESLEEVLQSNTRLQISVEKLQHEVQQKDYHLRKMKDQREQERLQSDQQLNTYQEKLNNLRTQTKSDMDSSRKRMQRELNELRKNYDDTVSKVSDLSKANTELRHKVVDVEQQSNRYKERIRSMKAQLEHYQKNKKSNEDMGEKLKAISSELAELEKVKNEYMLKNGQQSKTISSFVSQISSLQSELKTLSQAQQDLTEKCRKQEKLIEREKSKKEDIYRKYKTLQKRTDVIEDLRNQAEEKLVEANNESVQVSQNLQEAHDWFKNRFENLQTELVRSKRSHAALEKATMETQQQLMDEKLKAEETAQKARDMIRASRKQAKKIAAQMESAGMEDYTQYSQLNKQLQSEREHSKFLEKKLERLMNSSGRYIEDLATELEYYRSLSPIDSQHYQ